MIYSVGSELVEVHLDRLTNIASSIVLDWYDGPRSGLAESTFGDCYQYVVLGIEGSLGSLERQVVGVGPISAETFSELLCWLEHDTHADVRSQRFYSPPIESLSSPSTFDALVDKCIADGLIDELYLTTPYFTECIAHSVMGATLFIPRLKTAPDSPGAFEFWFRAMSFLKQKGQVEGGESA